MSELNVTHNIRIQVPQTITEEWLNAFNSEYSDSKYLATITTEDWLEQPVDEIGSGYFTLHDAMGEDGWKQTITGTIHSVANTNVPHYSDTGFADVLALTDVKRIRTDGPDELLAEGRLVLIRVDRLIDQLIKLEPKQQDKFFLPGGDGNWENLPVPENLKEAQDRIKVLESALGFYSDGRAYDSQWENDGIPSYSELMDDKGVIARIGRLAKDTIQFSEWVTWAQRQDKRW